MSSSDASHLIEVLILVVAVVTLISTVGIGVFAFRGWRETREIMHKVEESERKIRDLSRTVRSYSLIINLVLEKTSLIRMSIAKGRMQQFLMSLDPSIAQSELDGEIDAGRAFREIDMRLDDINWLLAKNDHEHRLFSPNSTDVTLAIEALIQSYGDGRTVEIFDRLSRLSKENEARYSQARSQLLDRMGRVNHIHRVYRASDWTGVDYS
jgi:hypothetical protein